MTVPEVAGLSLGAAASAIMDVGLTVDTPSLQHSSTVPKDHVIAQTPAAGESTPRLMPVSLVVSLGPWTRTEDEPPATSVKTNAVVSDSPSEGQSGE